MKVPTVHLNGTSGSELESQVSTIIQKLRSAKESMIEAWPHGRDYYTQGPESYAQVVEEWRSRQSRLQDMIEEFTILWSSIRDQNDDRRTRVVTGGI